ncbi:hypothetical protein ACFO25_04065 [Paenactinomyces guangxiensis]|uniref:Uncharacterized protein n=1 Tax=Paenactinomyces guangxiensis TaxID=1490290 RepID=A0A7W1WNU5_9BACL|nr:hypothetical protein [Paenactinomyces guangxiensis]MBA4493332.1 hypothetical protein [Paenactinomyces guangxiensis]MBH8593442.1 hypothetical protein [Paenactinomyces guangxiensis]
MEKKKDIHIVGDGNSYIESSDGSTVTAINDFKKVPLNKKDYRRIVIVCTLIIIIFIILGWTGVLGYGMNLLELYTMNDKFSKGDIPFNECGKIGTSLDSVVKKCGDKFPLVKREKKDVSGEWENIVYGMFDDHSQPVLELEFYKKKLVSITLIDHPSLRKFTKEQVQIVYKNNYWKNEQFEISMNSSWRAASGPDEENSPIKKVSITSKQWVADKAKKLGNVPKQPGESLPKEKQFIDKKSFLIRLLETAKKGDLLLYQCGKLGSTQEQILNACGREPYKYDSYKYYGKSEYTSIMYLKGDNFISLELRNNRLGRISISSQKLGTITLPYLKQVLGQPDRTIESSYKLSSHHYYVSDTLVLNFTNNLGNIESVTLYDKNTDQDKDFVQEWELE